MTIILTKKQFDYIFDLIFYNTKDGYNGECEFEHLIPHDKASTTEELREVLWEEYKSDNHAYTNDAFPKTSTQILTETFYDSYDYAVSLNYPGHPIEPFFCRLFVFP